MPSPATVAKALELIGKGAVNHSYFFSKLESPEWIGPLTEAGFFRDPPPRRVNGDYVSYPTWPESKYLARMAPVAPTLVADVIGRIPDTDNVSVHKDLARAVMHLSPRSMAQWATKEARWVSLQLRIEFPLDEALGAVIERLAVVGRTDAAVDLARSLLAIRCVADSGRHGSVREPSPAYESGLERSNGESSGEEDPDAAELAAPMVTELSSRIVGRLSEYEYRQFVQRYVPTLLTHDGIRAFEMLCDLLDNAIESDKLRRYDTAIWRPAIEPHAQNDGDHVADALIDAVRDASIQLVDAGVTLETVVESLARRTSPIFGRMILHLASEKHRLDLELAAELAAREDHFRDGRLLHEYSRLLGAVYPRLDDVRKNRVMKWIGDGPRFPESFAGDEEERRVWTIYWQARRLAWLRDHLDEEWKKRYARIVDEVGEPEHPEFTSYATSWMGPTSPLGVKDLEAMSTREVLGYLASWKPTGDPMSPDHEGLARVLEEVVGRSPDEFLTASDSILALRVRYVEALLRGLRQAVREDRIVDWTSVMALLSEISTRHAGGREWRWARLESVRLLEAGLKDDLIPLGLRSAVWAVIDSAADDSHPSPEDDAESTFHVATTSINTVRGEAMHAVVQYALWVYRSVVEANEGDSPAFDLNRIPKVRKRLDRHLDPAIEPSPSVRAVYGQWFPHLTLLDADWTEKNTDRIFPDRCPELRDAAWETYLRFCRVYDTPFELLREEYAAAVHRLPGSDEHTATTRGYPERRLGEHLLTMAGRGVLSWSDGDALLRRFFENARPQDAQGAIGRIGRELCQDEIEIPGEALERYRLLTEELLALMEATGRERMGHLSSLGWWIASGRFDPEWTLAHLGRLIELGGTAKPHFEVMDCLVELSEDHPVETFEVFSTWVSGDRRERRLLLRRGKAVRTILNAALANHSSSADARALIHRLGADGYLSFRDLLERVTGEVGLD